MCFLSSMESLGPERARFRSGHTQSSYLHFVVLFNLSAFFYFAHVFTLFSCFAAALSIHHLVFFVATFFSFIHSASGIDCVGHWNNGSCSSSCGMGTLTQTFQEDTPPRNGGICEASDGQTRSVGCDGLPSCRMLPVLLRHQQGAMLSVPCYSWPAPCLSTWLRWHLLRFQLVHLNPSVPPPLPQGLCRMYTRSPLRVSCLFSFRPITAHFTGKTLWRRQHSDAPHK